MRTMTVEVDGTTYTVEVGTNRHVTVNGQKVECDLQQVDRHRYVLLLDGHPYRIAAVRGNGGRYELLVGSTQHSAGCAGAVSLIGTHNGPARSAPGEIHAPMPALVARILVAQGDEVAAGQGLAVLEAMKMENEIRSPRAGVVRKVLVTPGMSVEKDQLLLVVE